MRPISLDVLTVMGMGPVEYIELAAELGCEFVGLFATPLNRIASVYPEWSLRGNPALVRDIKAALAHHGVSVRLGEGFLLQSDTILRDFVADLDTMADLGASLAVVCSFDAERPRAFDMLGEFTAIAARHGLDTSIEFVPNLGIANLASARDAIRHVGSGRLGIQIDAMHLFRSGGTADEVAALDPATIAYVQLCDVPAGTAGDYTEEACFGRLCPGQGDLPLADLVAALPAEVTIGVETPMRARILAGEKPRDMLRPCVAAVRELLAS